MNFVLLDICATTTPKTITSAAFAFSRMIVLRSLALCVMYIHIFAELLREKFSLSC